MTLTCVYRVFSIRSVATFIAISALIGLIHVIRHLPIRWGVVAERLRAPNSSSADSVQQSVSSNPGRDTCVPEQDT